MIALTLTATPPAIGQTVELAAPQAAAAALPGATAAAVPATTAPPRPRTKGDPWEKFNRGMFRLFQSFDRAVFRPVALAVGKIIPKPIRSGIRNFLRNLSEPVVFLNDVLQLKPGRAVRTLARFTLNSAVGLGGLADVAKTAKLPHRDNGLGNTLAHYGVGPGPYIFLPIIGPTTLRDFSSAQADRLVLPLAVGKPFNRFDWQLATGALAGLDQRIESDEDLRTLLSGAADPYATLRSVYLQSRIAEIAEIKGKTATPTTFEDPLEDPASADTAAPTGADAPVADPSPAPTEEAPAPPPAANEVQIEPASPAGT
ncbi:VacJ family lipoprotein [Novosphingobium sp. Chol11]|uniref:MlaA family lipoprotein n=1 Tax=Novosphingobium sp. Chol11 TaxID=1385763 RepID=UPI0025D27C6E|nr:VacJ family lipoprotein [Novosphingobium sp. Chol11]